MANEEEIAAQEATEDSAFNRLLGALIHPRVTFESVVNRPTWVLPLLLLIVVSVCVVFSYGHRVGWRGFFEQQMARNTRLQQLSPQQQQQALERQVKYAPVGGYAGATIGAAFIMLVVAGVLMGAFNVVFGATVRFKQALGITTHSFLPAVIRAVIGLIVIWVRPPEGVDLQNLVTSSAAAFLPANASIWARTLAGSFDLFTFWIIALLAIGFTAAGASRKVKIGSSLAVIGSLWLFWVLIIVGVTALLG